MWNEVSKEVSSERFKRKLRTCGSWWGGGWADVEYEWDLGRSYEWRSKVEVESRDLGYVDLLLYRIILSNWLAWEVTPRAGSHASQLLEVIRYSHPQIQALVPKIPQRPTSVWNSPLDRVQKLHTLCAWSRLRCSSAWIPHLRLWSLRPHDCPYLSLITPHAFRSIRATALCLVTTKVGLLAPLTVNRDH